jgi:hypothetical protein
MITSKAEGTHVIRNCDKKEVNHLKIILALLSYLFIKGGMKKADTVCILFAGM